MIKIAICDDEQTMVSNNEAIVKESLQRTGIAYEITTYVKSSNLLADIAEDNFFYDLILLDIEMPEYSGMEVAEKVKNYLPHIKIIFITSHVEYAIDAYELSIFRYVPKNDIKERLSMAVKDAAVLIEMESGQEYTIQNNNRMERIRYKDIVYMQRDGKNVSIVAFNGVSKIRKSLQQVYEELNAPEFIYIERGCIVNIIHINKLDDAMVHLKDGSALPISRSHLQEVKQNIAKFWGEHI